ncbi:glycoside hydrolase family 85 protein [Scleroderma yunnanense]
MPLRGVGHSRLVGDEAPYFDSLAEVDAWFTQPRRKLTGVLHYQPRPHIEGKSSSRGKLLVCHDYKGGYTESPSGKCYTFSFWSLCDTFVYFSHHRVTIPPSGWTNAAHKQGVKMLGTLLFEHTESSSDGMKLLLGNVPNLTMDSGAPSGSIPLSRHYASRLAELAFQRGFDGYLLNFESSLPGGSEQARALATWVALLRAELHTKVGSHADVVWYDSVTISGQLKYQNRLNHYNLPFFIASDAFFTNYFWPPQYPSFGASYFLNIDPILLGSPRVADNSPPRVKTLRSVFVGVDVWGRNQYGGGGLNSYRAITHIDPQSLGLSVAFFAPGWTWESKQDTPGWNWEQWWKLERQLWIGPSQPDEVVPVPDPPRWPYGYPDRDEGPFKPISAFFVHAPPPDPLKFAFYTCFSPGIGHAWFVNGEIVLQTEESWTDIDKQCSMGNLAWPRPVLQWEGDERTENVPDASTGFDMTDGWNGGSALKVTVICGGSSAEDAFFRCVWIPVQSLTVTAEALYEACIVYKTSTGEGCDLDLSVNIKSLSSEAGLSVEQAIVTDLQHGWSQQTLQFTVTSLGTTSVAVGLIVGFAAEDPTLPCNFTISLGQLAVYPASPLPPVSVGSPSVSWTSFAPTSANSADSLANLAGTLTWDTAISLPPMNQIPLEGRDSEDPRPAWVLDNDILSCPSFIYFNIYIAVTSDSTDILDPLSATFIGTTGLDGRGNRFYVEPQCLPQGLESKKAARFFVQGVTNRGEVLPWDRCAFVDYDVRVLTGQVS